MFQITPSTPWLAPEEQPEVIARLLDWGLIQFDNRRSLPLKSGGTTDVYLNLRDARDDPHAVDFITQLFALAIRRLDVDRFIEVPDAVSCFAGPVSVETDIPYLTVRKRPKEGRVADARVIGHAEHGEKVCIMDDVITTGGSKVLPIEQCHALGLDPRALVVLVDRQQGWQQDFARLGIDVPVWPGMTLHDVRRHLIQSLGVMQRCNPELEAHNPIVVALDGKPWDEILPVIDRLRTTGCILKVNDLAVGKGVEWLLPNLSVYGRVMLDLKLHDIPNTLRNVMRRLHDCPPWAVTVHGSGGPEMIEAAVEELAGTDTKVLVVTVLTSMTDDCEEVYSRMPIEQVRILAEIAHKSGAHGLVCSPHEVDEMRAKYPDMTLVVPAVRSPGEEAADQKRVATPRATIDAGADHIVMGRQVFGADDPVAEVGRVLREELDLQAFVSALRSSG